MSTSNPAASGEGVISGTVRDGEGEPLRDARITLYSKQFLDAHVQLASGSSNADGFFRLVYPRSSQGPSIFLEVRRGDGYTVDSPVIFQASADERLDVIADPRPHRGPSQFRILRERLATPLSEDGLPFDSLLEFKPEDVAYLAVRTSADPDDIQDVQQALSLENELGFPAELFFGMARQGVSGDLSDILAVAPSARRRALDSAYEARQISSEAYSHADGLLQKLEVFAMDAALEIPDDPNRMTLGALFEKGARLDPEQSRGLLELYRDTKGSIEEFWEQAEVDFGSHVTDPAKFALQLGSIVEGHLPMVARLAEEKGYTSFDELGELTKADWEDHVGVVGVPPILDEAGVTPEQYAEVIYSAVEESFPTQVLRTQLHRFPRSDLTGPFFANNPNYDIRSSSLLVYLRDKEVGGPEPEETKRRLLSMESIYRIAPRGRRIETMELLLGEGIDSPTKIRTMGKAAFTRKLEGKLAKEEAETIFARASQATALATLLQLRHGSKFNHAGSGSGMQALASVQSVSAEIPDWENLFGGADFCSCEECQSILSPAAYLFDLLQWLEGRSAEGGKSAYDVLVARRPDLPYLQLSCKNTHTPLPYIDLVNETLELAVAEQSGPVSYQTEGDAANLAVQPENLNEIAYRRLCGEIDPKKSVYPFGLPFDLWAHETRSYLGLLGVERHEIVEEFGVDGGDTDRAADLEVLQLTLIEAAVITRTLFGVDAHDYWGMGSDYQAELASVGKMLRQASPDRKEPLTFDALLDLFRASYVQVFGASGQPSEIRFTDKSCQTSTATIVPLEAIQLARIDQLLRLHIRLGMSIHELDAAIQAFGGSVDYGFLASLADVRRLQQRLRLDTLPLLSFWSTIDTRRWKGRMVSTDGGNGGIAFVFDPEIRNPRPPEDGNASFYEKLFLSRSVHGTEALPSAFFLNDTGDDLEGSDELLENHTAVLTAALDIGEAELVPLLRTVLPDEPKLTLQNVSHLHRHAALARALGLSVGDLRRFIGLLGFDPFASPTETLRFVDAVREVQRGPFTLQELNYLLRDVDTEPATLGMTDQELEVHLYGLRSALQSAQEAQGPLPDLEPLDHEELRRSTNEALTSVLGEATAREVLPIVDRHQENPVPGKDPDVMLLRDQFSTIFSDIEQAILALLTGTTELIKLPEDRLRYLLPALLEVRPRVAAATQFFSATFGLPSNSVAALLQRYATLQLPENEQLRGIDIVLDPEPSPEGETLQARYLRLFDKLAQVIDRLDLSVKHFPWVFEVGPKRGTLNPCELPLDGKADADYPGWRRLAEAATLQSKEFRGELFDLFLDADAASDGADSPWSDSVIREEIANRTAWPLDDLGGLCDHFGFSFPDHFQDEVALVRIARSLQTIQKTKLKLGAVLKLAAPAGASSARKEQAEVARQAARSSLGPSEWLKAARPVRDKLRERQRDALGAWLIAHEEGFDAFTDLYDHYLLDVEMSSCATTSRIRLALSSVQLLVQRSLMSLESSISLSPADSEEWEPLSRYRVWEANRKILLYPENWLDPELRDDKTPFFKELEEELIQSDLDEEAIDSAISNYLAKLVEVSKLEVVGYEIEKETIDGALPFDALPQVEHVIARTPAKPHKYFYRRRLNGQRWTPWEHIPLDIVGDQILPVFYQGALHLFWLQVQEKEASPPGGITIPDPNMESSVPAATKYKEYRLEWSVYQRGHWRPKRTTLDSITDRTATSLGLDEWAGSATEYTTDAACLIVASKDRSELVLAVVYDGQETHTKRTTYNYDNALITHVETRQRYAVRLIENTFKFFQGDHVEVQPAPIPNTIGILNPKNEPALSAQNLTSQGILFLPAYHRTTDAWQTLKTFQATPSQYLIGPIRSLRSDFGRSQQLAPLIFYSDGQNSFYITNPEGWEVRNPQSGTPKVYIPDAKGTYLPWRDDPRPGDESIHRLVFNGIDPTIKLIERFDGPDAIRQVASRAIDAGVRADKAIGNAFPAEPITSLGTSVTYALEGGASQRFLSSGFQSTGNEVQFNAHVFSNFIRDRVSSMTGQSVATAARLKEKQPTQGSDQNIRMKDPDGRVEVRPFSQPFAQEFLVECVKIGFLGMLKSPGKWERQKLEKDASSIYRPTDRVDLRVQSISFDPTDAYAVYNLEVFLHIPLLIANLLAGQRKFELARDWMHCVFDPTGIVVAGEPIEARHWRFRPFAEAALKSEFNTELEQLRAFLYGDLDNGDEDIRRSLSSQVEEWRQNPFMPHAVARLRHSSYMKHVVMSYISNLINWGDDLFREDTIESINEASLLYLMAARLLGTRPQDVEVRTGPAPTYAELAHGETPTPVQLILAATNAQRLLSPIQRREQLPPLPWAFCAPPNPKLVAEFWDRVADRLFKVRHCLNIEGTYRELDLFDPPIDPGLLARARAAGLDLGAVLRESRAPIPSFRFRHIYQKALELVSDVTSLGSAFLGALEKRDSEALQMLRAGHQGRIQKAALTVLEDRAKEAVEAIEGLVKSSESIEYRVAFYRSRKFRNAQEARQETSLIEAQRLTAEADRKTQTISILGALPQFTTGANGFGGTPTLQTSFGSAQVISAIQAEVAGVRMRASRMSHVASLAGISASHIRRKEDWDFQADLADRELEGLNKQILAAKIRLAIAEKEIENHKLQMKHQEEEEAFLKTKFTNTELYGWMVNQTSSLYFQSYQLAYELAKKAERAWQFELGLPERSFITHGHWDGLKKGLLAGEKLRFELRQMDAAYLDSQKRELELSMSISLREVRPDLLATLKSTRRCNLSIDEDALDRDYAGLYMRRIRSVALTIPSVTGPHTPVRCSLTLDKSRVRFTPSPRVDPPESDPGLRLDNLGIRAIITSRGESDTGLFGSDASDDRYSPFEGAGAISDWTLQLPDIEGFDYSTISDVVLEVQYTALDGGEPLRQAAQNRLVKQIAEDGFSHGYDLRSLAPEEASTFLDPTSTGPQAIEIPLKANVLPHAIRSMNPRVSALTIVLHRRGAIGRDLDLSGIALRIDGVHTKLDRLEAEGGTILHAHVNHSSGFGETVSIEVEGNLPPDHPLVIERDGVRRLLIDEMVLVVHGKAEAPKGGPTP